MSVLGIGLIAVGIIIFLIGSIEFIIAAFRVSIWWGLGVLLFGALGQLLFLIVRVDDAWPATRKVLIAVCMFIVGSVLINA
jgi:hypothetical protein